METTENYVSIMIDGLKQKILILNKIIGSSYKEKELLLEDPFHMDDFDSNMKEKSNLIDKLSKLDDGFTSVYNRVKVELEDNKSMYEEQIKQMKVLISKITELSVKIQTQETRNRELAQKKFQNLKKEVQQAKRSERMASNYYKSMGMIDTEPQFIDKKK